MPAIVDECKTELIKTDEGKANYSQLTLSLSVDNGAETPLAKKIFFKLPFDSYAAKAGEPEKLFSKFRRVTGMSAEDCLDTDNYKNQGFYVLVGPDRNWQGVLRTYEQKDTGETRLSMNITDIYDSSAEDFSVEALEEGHKNYTQACVAEMTGATTAKPATAKDMEFKDEKKDMPTF